MTWVWPRAGAMLAAVGMAAAAVVGLGPSRGVAVAGAKVGATAGATAPGLHGIEQQVTAAERHYSHVLRGLTRSVSRAVSLSQRDDALRQRAGAAHQEVVAEARALYESGGPLAAYAAVLSSANVTDLAQRTALAGQLLSVQAYGAADAAARSQAAAAALREATDHEARIVTARDVTAAADRVQALLGREQQMVQAAQARQALLAAQTAAVAAITTTAVAGLQVLPPSATYLSLYRSAAATCPGLSWTVLAAIGQVESGHGRNPSTSSAGAMGPMQFEPATFGAYAVDGDDDGVASIQSPADAIYTAARYLCANGAGRGSGALAAAIFRYNHADWYVAMVLRLADLYRSWAP